MLFVSDPDVARLYIIGEAMAAKADGLDSASMHGSEAVDGKRGFFL